MATLRKKSDAYFIDYRINGRRVRKSVGRSKKIAELALKDLEVKLARKELGFENKDHPFRQLLTEYHSYCQTNLAPNTTKRYKSITDNFERFLLKEFPYLEKISHFKPKVFEDYKKFRKDEGAQNRTINHELIVVRMMFRLAIQWGHAKDNPTDGVSKLRIVNKTAPAYLTEEQCRTLLENADQWFYPILFTFLNSGMRKGELENLTWDDVDLGRKKLRIVAKEDWTPKTDEREIPINEGLYKVLLEQKNKANGNRYVFPDKDGEKVHPNKLRKKFISLTKKCEFPELTQVHALRHTFASHLVMKGVDLATVKRLMGHSDIDTTMIYSHLSEKHVDEAVDRLSFGSAIV